jgi:hypothetical protein
MTPHLAEQPQQQAREVLRVPDGILDRPRPTAHQVLVNVAGGHGYFDRQVLAVEVVMNEEWWRGYAAALAALAPAPQGDAGEDIEAMARIIYAAMCWTVVNPPVDRQTPNWQPGGNSFAQAKAREAARDIAAAIRATAGDGR